MTKPDHELSQIHEFSLVVEVDTGDQVRRGIVRDRVQKALDDPRTQEAFREALPGVVEIKLSEQS